MPNTIVRILYTLMYQLMHEFVQNSIFSINPLAAVGQYIGVKILSNWHVWSINRPPPFNYCGMVGRQISRTNSTCYALNPPAILLYRSLDQSLEGMLLHSLEHTYGTICHKWIKSSTSVAVLKKTTEDTSFQTMLQTLLIFVCLLLFA